MNIDNILYIFAVVFVIILSLNPPPESTVPTLAPIKATITGNHGRSLRCLLDGADITQYCYIKYGNNRSECLCVAYDYESVKDGKHILTVGVAETESFNSTLSWSHNWTVRQSRRQPDTYVLWQYLRPGWNLLSVWLT